MKIIATVLILNSFLAIAFAGFINEQRSLNNDAVKNLRKSIEAQTQQNDWNTAGSVRSLVNGVISRMGQIGGAAVQTASNVANSVVSLFFAIVCLTIEDQRKRIISAPNF